MSLQREIKVLEEKLQEVEAWEKRVQELGVLLGIQEGIDEDEEEVEGDRDESEEVLLQEMERQEEEAVAVVGDDTESSSFVSASLGSFESEMVESGVDLGIGLEELGVESPGGAVGITEDGIVVDVGFEEAVDEEELEMEAGADIE
jgi:hypothetical protein